jgi:hypothetical protein
MATSEQRRERIARIAALPEALAAVVNGLGDAELDARAAADPWTVRQVTHHIADSHVNAYIRMKLMLTEAHPTIKPYDQEAWAGLADSALPVDATLSLLRGLHARWIELFEALDESDWNRTAYHPENGDITLDWLLDTYARHGQEHLDQIQRIRQATASGNTNSVV